jgi:hypothetical protein
MIYWQLFGIGCLIAVACILIFRWKAVVRLYQESKRPLGQSPIHQIINKKPASKPPTKKDDINHATADAATAMVERGMSAVYRGWHALPAVARFVLCLPACALLVAVFFFGAIWPSFLGALSFGASNVLLQDLSMIPIFTMHLSIYLFMSRGRFILSGLLALGILIFTIIAFIQLPHGADFWDVTYRGFYHCIAAFCVGWAWVKSGTNRPAAMFHLAGGLILASGVLNIILSILMFCWVPSQVADGAISHQVLALPIYNSFEPFIGQIMTPLHLHIGDFTPENLVLAFLIMIWGGLLFCLGGFMCHAKYTSIANTPSNITGWRY